MPLLLVVSLLLQEDIDEAEVRPPVEKIGVDDPAERSAARAESPPRSELALCLALPLWAPAPHDLDVEVAPGTPLEWTKELRTPVPTAYRGSVPTGGAHGVLEGNTTALGVEFGSLNPLGLSRITTLDLPGHLPWTVPEATEGSDRVPTPGGTITWEYPPAVTTLQWWWCMAVILRASMHPALVSKSECISLLLEIGEPARLAADAAQHCEPDIVRVLRAEGGRVPQNRPKAPAMESPLQSMFAKLAAEELTSDYPHGLNPYFAQRLLSLGEQAFPAVLACAKSEHSFLRRNAVAVLPQYANREGLTLLREYLNSRDLVVRTRAVLGLARRHDRETVPILVKWLGDTDRVKRALAAHALGLLGHGDAAEPLLKAAKASITDGDFLFSAVPALARIRLRHDEFTADLRGVVNALAERTYDVAPPMRPDVIDAGGTRRDILKEFGLLALAAQGEKPASDEVLKKTTWRPAAQYLAIEVLGGLGEKGVAALKALAADATIEPAMRAQAFIRASMPVPEAPYVKKIIADEVMPPGIRGLALTMLSGFDPLAVREAGLGIVQAFLKGRYRTPEEAYLVQAAVQVLGRSGNLEVDALVDIVALAMDQRKRRAKPKAAPQQPFAWQQEVRIVIDVPLLESAVLELGRTRSKRAADVLAALLEDGASEARAEAALALGAIGGKRAIAALLVGLEDKDGWVRFASYTALRALSGRDFFCDWIYGGAVEREEVVKAWKELLQP